MINRFGLDVGCRVRLPDDREGTVAPTGSSISNTEVNVMLDYSGSITTCVVSQLDVISWPRPR